ncbi:hypothetical protein [Frankia sp. QA3]|uniref:hypothetical protein n=1 Tax=Frankia sp. QA3 TaxID=710111 RepID=UPI000269C50B|nr:hypothetical protein [Frankia sp. QA3]EIV94359.1 hypothetical protein FraQA3DRAFT_4111 [Frankia sp. QA3]
MSRPAQTTGAVAVPVDWAVFGKERGQRDDYGVLRASALRIRRGTFDRLVRQYSPGSPTGPHADTPAALPWVTFSGTGISGVRYIGVAICRWPRAPQDDVDAFGRTFVTTWFFCLPFEDFHRYFGTYGALYDAVRDVRPDTDGAELHLPRPEPDPAVPAEYGAFGPAERLALVRHHPQAAGVAARLLDGAVTLTHPAHQRPPSIEDRIRFFDAVCALLPAGIQGILPAGTWADWRTEHQLRLVYGSREGSDVLDLGTDPSTAVSPTSNARRYLALLAWGDDDAELTRRLTTLAARPAWLDPDRKLSFHQPGTILATLGLIRAAELARSYDTGRITLGALATECLALPPEADADGHLVSLLIRAGGEAQLPAIERLWSRAALDACVERCTALLARTGAGRSTMLTELLRYAAEQRPTLLPAVVARILLDGTRGPAADPAGRSIAEWTDAGAGGEDADGEDRRLVLHRALQLVRDHAGPGAGEGWDEVRRVLAEDGRLAVELAHVLIRNPRSLGWDDRRDLTAWLDWAEDGGGPAAAALAPYRIVLGPGADHLRTEQVAELAEVWPVPTGGDAGPVRADRHVQSLVCLAARVAPGTGVPRAVLEWARGVAPLGRSRHESWRTFLAGGNLRLSEPERRGLREALEHRPSRRDGRAHELLPRGGAFAGDRPSPTGGPDGSADPPAAGWADFRPVAAAARWTASQDGDATSRRLAWYRPPAADTAFFADSPDRVAVAGPSRPGDEAWSCSVAYDDLATAGCGLRELHRAVQAASPAAQGADEYLELPALDVAETVANIERFGFAQVAAAAALLLDGPLSVLLRHDQVELDDRLRFVDAVLALLPFGVRSTMSVASLAAAPPTLARHRLTFAAYPPPTSTDRHTVVWSPHPAVAPPLRSGLARLYFRLLVLTRSRLLDPPRLVESLAHAGDPIDLERPETVSRVARLDLPALRAATDVTTTPELLKAREALSGRVPSGPGATSTVEVNALATLLAGGGLADLELAGRYADGLRIGGRLDEMLVKLLDRCDGSWSALSVGTMMLLRRGTDNEPAPPVVQALRRVPAVALDLLAELALCGEPLPQLRWWMEALDPAGRNSSLAPFRAVVYPSELTGLPDWFAALTGRPEAQQAFVHFVHLRSPHHGQELLAELAAAPAPAPGRQPSWLSRAAGGLRRGRSAPTGEPPAPDRERDGGRRDDTPGDLIRDEFEGQAQWSRPGYPASGGGR